MLNDSDITSYKTGGADIAPKKLSALEAMEMNRNSIKENIKSFQLPLYYYFVSKSFTDFEVNAELYNIRNLKRTPFICEDDLGQKGKIMGICLKAIEAVFAELFNPSIPFKPDKEERKCQFCPFSSLCI